MSSFKENMKILINNALKKVRISIQFFFSDKKGVFTILGTPYYYFHIIEICMKHFNIEGIML